MSDAHGLPDLDRAAAAAVDQPVAGPPALADVVGRATTRRRRKRGALTAAVLAIGVGVGAAWPDDERPATITDAPDVVDTTTTVDEADVPAESSAPMRLERIAAIGDQDGTSQVDLLVTGSAPDPEPVAVRRLEDAPLDQIGFYLATENDVLWMCDSWHSWGGAEAAVGLTIPAAWFDPSTLQIESPIADATSPDGEPALVAKIITCELASGLWQMTIHGPRGGPDAEVAVTVVDGAIRVTIDEPAPEPEPDPEPEAPIVPSDLWLRREAGVIVGDTLVVPGQLPYPATDVRLVSVDLVTGDERIVDAPEGLFLGDQSPEWAELRPILTVWNDRVVVCCSGFSGGEIAAYDPVSGSWDDVPDIPGGFTEGFTRSVTVTDRGLLALGRDGAALLDSLDGAWETVAGPLPGDPDAHRLWTTAAIGDDVLVWPVHFTRNSELGLLLDLSTGQWRQVPAPADLPPVPAAASLVVAADRFVLVGGQPASFAHMSEALIVLTLDPASMTWSDPQFPLPEPDSFEGNIGSQRLVPSADDRLIFDAGALGGGVSLVEIDPSTGEASAFNLLDPPSVLAIRADGTFLRRLTD